MAGRRVLAWLSHADFLLQGVPQAKRQAFHASLAGQLWFLHRRRGASPGLPRITALCALVTGGVTLKGNETWVAPALAALARACATDIDAQGGLASRNPEELLDIFSLLTGLAAIIDGTAHALPEPCAAAIGRSAGALRTLAHGDGGLARFHGGDRGVAGRLDQALCASGVKTRPGAIGRAMGYARIAAGRSTLIVDAAPPPVGPAGQQAHASTLAVELTSGRRPVIVSAGCGARLGAGWRRAGRSTPSHSALSLEGQSSARFAQSAGAADSPPIVSGPSHVPLELSEVDGALRFEGSHDGYVGSHGLTTVRSLEVSRDGRRLDGEDMLLALDAAGKVRFERLCVASKLRGLAYAIRFHLHPDVAAETTAGGNGVVLTLKSGEEWIFHHSGGAHLGLDPGAYLDPEHLRPRATKQIVLTGVAMKYATRIRWSLAQAGDATVARRDLQRDDLEAVY